MIQEVMGLNVKDIPGKTLWEELMKKYNVFHIKKANKYYNEQNIYKTIMVQGLGRRTNSPKLPILKHVLT